MKIQKALLDNFNKYCFGRIRLKIFKEITGEDNEQPTKKEGIDFIEKLAAINFDIAELYTYILTNGESRIIATSDLSSIQLHEIDPLFNKLNAFPKQRPYLFEINDVNENICAWIKCNQLSGNNGYFYTIILFTEQNFPLLFYTEIRVSQISPDPSIIFYNQDGSPTILKKSDPGIINNESIMFCLMLLKHIDEKEIDLFEPVGSTKKWHFDKALVSPKDKKYYALLKKVSKKQIYIHFAEVNLDEVIPFSYDFCFSIPLSFLKKGKKYLTEIRKRGLLLYWNGSKFVMSDDYLSFMVLRIEGDTKIRAAILGTVPNHIVSKTKGYFELLPPTLNISKNSYEVLDLELKQQILDDYIKEIKTIDNISDFITAKCVVFSEDTNTQYLETILIANNFNIDETKIISYKNCTNIAAIELNVENIKKINPNVLVIIHRDRDYLPISEIIKIELQISKAGATPFITDGTDIEAYFLNEKHICKLNSQISQIRVRQLLKNAITSTKKEAITNIRKFEYGEKHANKTGYLDEYIDKIYNTDTKRYAPGKTTLKTLRSLLQHELKKNPVILKPTPFLKIDSIEQISKKIWE